MGGREKEESIRTTEKRRSRTDAGLEARAKGTQCLVFIFPAFFLLQYSVFILKIISN